MIILEALANPHKEQVKGDGVNMSDWSQSLFIIFNPQLHVD